MRAERALTDSQPCPNCGDPTPGNYCPTCGQRRVLRVLSLRRLVADAVEDQFSLNAALPRTLRILFTHPGQLTHEFLRGRIASYIPPFRLYLLTSFVFFLTVAIFGCDGDGEENDPDYDMQVSAGSPDTVAAIVARLRDSAAAATAGTPQTTESPAARTDSALLAEADSAAARERRRVLDRERNVATINEQIDSFFDDVRMPFKATVRERVRTRALTFAELDEGFEDLVRRELYNRLPIVIFLLVPVFTAIMKLLYIRQRRYYVEHFVFALHVHSFLFLSMTLLVVLPQWWLANLLLGLWLVAYIFLSMRRVYEQSKLMTFFKYVLLAGTYAVLALIGLLGTVLYTFLFATV